MHLTNVPFKVVVAIRAGAGQAVGRIGIRNLGVGVPRTRITGLNVPKITSVTQAGDAWARAVFDDHERQLKHM